MSLFWLRCLPFPIFPQFSDLQGYVHGGGPSLQQSTAVAPLAYERRK